eukprot:CAMPEP_0197031176 /NCGR_PEP_ID=MMETSP1384-20130603/10256_1 /TAXON_ID=29189 /ORGANISM="Ammonia sp." /LENGTH=1199 /DNA_ID=CAMNT_0042460667 /DNA_START=278 /DNA_END=3876 /DNA_ORIENTATION=+
MTSPSSLPYSNCQFAAFQYIPQQTACNPGNNNNNNSNSNNPASLSISGTNTTPTTTPPSSRSVSLSSSSSSSLINQCSNGQPHDKNTVHAQQQKTCVPVAECSENQAAFPSNFGINQFSYFAAPPNYPLAHLALNPYSNAHGNGKAVPMTAPFVLNPYDPHNSIAVVHSHNNQVVSLPAPLPWKSKMDALQNYPCELIHAHEEQNHEHERHIVSIPAEFASVVNNDDFSELFGMQNQENSTSDDAEHANDQDGSKEVEMPDVRNEEQVNGGAREPQQEEEEEEEQEENEEEAVPGPVVDEAELIARRKQKIIDFLTKEWDNYPTTSSNGEQQQQQSQSETQSPSKRYTLPPGLHNTENGKPLQLNSNGNSNGHRKRKLMPMDEEGHDTEWTAQQYVTEGPPYKFNGSFEDAKIMGIRDNKWIMLNIHDTDLFTAQFSNPLIWKHQRYGVLIESNFILFNCLKGDCVGFVQLYNIENVPSIAIIDPFTNVKTYEFVSPSTSSNIVKLRSEILELLQTAPSPKAYISDKLRAPSKPTKPPIPHRHHQSSSSSSSDSHQSSLPLSASSSPTVSRHHRSNVPSTPPPPARVRPVLIAKPGNNVTSTQCNNHDHHNAPQQQLLRLSPSSKCTETNVDITISNNSKKKKQSGFHFTSSFEISSEAHIYCNSDALHSDGTHSANIWDLCYPYTNLKKYAYVLSTRQTFNWADWMHIIRKCHKIVGAIPSEQHIEFLRNRNGEMTLESSGTYNGWWSEQRIAEYVVNEKFGLSFEGGFASENGRERRKFLKSLELPRRPTFKKMLIIIADLDNEDKVLFHENSLSITSYSDYDKMDNVTSFQLWLSFVSYLAVHMLESSRLFQASGAYHRHHHHHHHRHHQYTNFCIKLGSKWKLPLKTLYNDMQPLLSYAETHAHCAEILDLFSYPKIATDATTNKSSSSSLSCGHCGSTSSCSSCSMSPSSSPPPEPPMHCNGNGINNKYHMHQSGGTEPHKYYGHGAGFEVNLFHRVSKQKRTNYIKSYQELERCLLSADQEEIIDFPFPLFSSGWFSFNTLSPLATILEQHLNGTWVSMYSPNSRKQFKQIFDINKNTRRRPLVYTKLLQQKINQETYKSNYVFLSKGLCAKSKQRLLSFWNENRLHCTDLIMDPMNKCISNPFLHSNEHANANENDYDAEQYYGKPRAAENSAHESQSPQLSQETQTKTEEK